MAEETLTTPLLDGMQFIAVDGKLIAIYQIDQSVEYQVAIKFLNDAIEQARNPTTKWKYHDD